MRSELQMRIVRRLPFVLAIVLLLLHSTWVLMIDHSSRRDWEFERAWAVQYYLDLPVSLLANPVFHLADLAADRSLSGFNHNYHFVFFLVAGGGQYFLWGWLIGSLWNKQVQPRLSRSNSE